MRFPSFPTFLRTLYTFSNTTVRATQSPFAHGLRPAQAIRSSMPTIPFLGALFSTADTRKMSHPVQKSDSEWQAVLNPGTSPDIISKQTTQDPTLTVHLRTEQFRVIRQKGTEAPFSGEYDKHYPSTGTYNCAACDAPLYRADQKFKSGCGWPAFFDTVPGAVTRHSDRTFGMERIEIVCSNCGGHLGHVFKGEGYNTPTDERHCVNSVSMKFSDKDPVVDGAAKAKA